MRRARPDQEPMPDQNEKPAGENSGGEASSANVAAENPKDLEALVRTYAAELAHEKDQLQSILETAPDPVVVINERGIVQSFNAAAIKAFGYAADEVVGRNVGMLMPSPDRELHDSYIERYLTTNVPHVIGIGREVTAQRKDGSVFPARLAISEARGGERRLFTGFVQNLSAQKEAEAALRASEGRLRETQSQLYYASRHGDLGEMAGAISHELNQPLTAIINYVQTCRDLLANVPEAPANVIDYLDRTAAQTERAGLIIRRLRQLYERGDADAVPDDLNETVSEALDLALVGAKEGGVQVRVDLDAELPEVVIDRQQIQQVVINLVRNALEALEEVDHRELIVRTYTDERGAALLVVDDTGPGLAPEIAESLFAPFQTTKPEGMGLGLSICRSIVDGHGGEIWATAPSTGGTAFHVLLHASTASGEAT